MLKKSLLIVIASLMSTAILANQIDLIRHNQSSKSTLGFSDHWKHNINSVNDIEFFTGPMLGSATVEVSVYPHRESNDNLTSDAVTLNCKGKPIRVIPGERKGCFNIVGRNQEAKIYISPSDYKNGATMEIYYSDY